MYRHIRLQTCSIRILNNVNGARNVDTPIKLIKHTMRWIKIFPRKSRVNWLSEASYFKT